MTPDPSDGPTPFLCHLDDAWWVEQERFYDLNAAKNHREVLVAQQLPARIVQFAGTGDAFLHWVVVVPVDDDTRLSDPPDSITHAGPGAGGQHHGMHVDSPTDRPDTT